eukprot:GSChrysophyteH1.ASY1.ANO1.1390.1 assembled CDS
MTVIPDAVDDAVHFWQNFDLSGKISSLGVVCEDMRESKSMSIAGRKRLNDLTKEFRSRSNEGQLETVTDVLRAYQEEIDQLSRRSKFSESAFYGLYKDIQNAPDPYHILQNLSNAGDSSSSPRDTELEQLRKEIALYEEEFKTLKNQDGVILRLQDQLQVLQGEMEVRVAAEAQLRVSDQLASVLEEKRAVERRLAISVEGLSEAQLHARNVEQKLIHAQSESDSRVEALMAERALLLDSVERNRAEEVELTRKIYSLDKLVREKDEYLRLSEQQLQEAREEAIQGQARSSFEKDDHSLSANLRKELEDSASALLREINRADEAMQKVDALETHVRTLQSELQLRPTQDELTNSRRQARLFRRIAFNEQSDSCSDDDHEYQDTDTDANSTLLAKIKLLETQLSLARSTEHDLTEKNKELAKVVVAAELKATESSNLVSLLEKELEVRNEGAVPHGAATMMNTSQNNTSYSVEISLPAPPEDGADKAKKRSSVHDTELSELLSVNTERSTQKQQHFEGEGIESKSCDTKNPAQMVSIFQGQRDRYKKSLLSTEKALLQIEQKLRSEQELCKQLQSDNKRLYDRFRFLQSQVSGSGQSWSPSGALRDLEAAEDVERRYCSAYSENMNPFHEFAISERKRYVNELSPSDRLVYSTLSTFISTQGGRTGMLTYFATMHVLVFVSLFFLVSHADHGCDLAIDHLAHLE